MQNIVLDTNCLILSLSANNQYRSVWEGFLEEKYTLCITNDILEEYIEVIGRNIRPSFAESIAYIILNSSNVKFVDPTYSFELIRTDVDDNKFVDCAIVSNARFIVTQDRHFDVLKKIDFPHVEVIRIDAFVEELEKW